MSINAARTRPGEEKRNLSQIVGLMRRSRCASDGATGGQVPEDVFLEYAAEPFVLDEPRGELPSEVASDPCDPSHAFRPC